MTKFPKVLAAARQLEIDQWALGDALIEECGEPARAPRAPGVNDGSRALLEECSEFLSANGLPDYHVTYLAKIRNTAFDFHGRDRKAGLSWSAHYEAGSPEVLQSIISGAPEKKRVTRDYVRDIRNAAETVESAANLRTLRDTRTNMPVPPARGDIAEPRIAPVQVIGLQFVVELGKARKEIERIVEAFEEEASRIRDAELACINRDFLAIAELSRRAASLKRTRPIAVGE